MGFAPIVVLVALSFALGYAALFYGGVLDADWNVCLLVLGCTAILYCLLPRGSRRIPKLDRRLLWPLVLLPCYLALQLTPLPLGWLGVLSPHRAEVTQWLSPLIGHVGWAPISVTPSLALERLFRICAYIVVFLLVRELTWRFEERRWLVIVPLLLIAGAEAALGMLQLSADPASGLARGTFVDRDHFAGLLEMVLPFAAMGGVATLRAADFRYRSPLRPALIACVYFSLAALLLVGIIYSQSRMGFLAALFSLFVVAALSIGSAVQSRRARWGLVAFVAVSIVLLFVFLPPDQLIARFADMAATNKISGDGRMHFWTQTLTLISAYPVFGVGLGGYEAAFRRYQKTETFLDVDFAHNDYLQYLAELGLIGFLLLAAVVALVVWKGSRAIFYARAESHYLAIACVGSLSAILLHSFVDFNMQIPSNATAFAWVCGVTTALYARRSETAP
jgi:O-antigen ligase